MRDPNKRAVLIETVIASGLIAIGFTTGQGPLLALAATATSVGCNWSQSLAHRGYQHWCARWFTDDGVLNKDITKALCHAFEEAVRQVEHDWQHHRHYQHLQHRWPEQAQLTLNVLRGLREDGVRLFQQSDHLVQVAQQEQHQRVLSLLYQDEFKARESASEYLKPVLTEYLYGHDDEFVTFVTDQLGPKWLVRFVEILKNPNEEGTRAWRACQLLWQQSLHDGISHIQLTTAETAEAVRWLHEWAQQLTSQPPMYRNPIGQEALADIVQAMQARLDDIHAVTGRIETKLDQVYQKVAPTKQWLRPPRPTLPKTFVGREMQCETLVKDLLAGQSVAITGHPLVRTLQGMGGIGKTYLALKVALELYDHFPGGVLRIDLGPQVTDEASIQVPLSRLASYAFGGIPPAGPFQPEQVAAWLTEMAPGRLLVLFDDVWHPAPLRLLSRALPADAVRLVTTRSSTVAQAVGGKLLRVDRLTLDEGVALFEDRLGCRGNITYRADLEALVRLLDGHPLALDIAAARINQPWRARAILQGLQQSIGRGELTSLKLPPSEERDDNLEKSLALSYDWMTGEQQRRFRALGVFAAEAPIPVPAAAAVWEMDDAVVTETALLELVDLAVLTAIEESPGISYRQHGLLSVYARALLEKTGDLTRASQVHAQYYTRLVEATDIPEYAQLDQHMPNLLTALHWTVDHEPPLFLHLLDASRQILFVQGQSVLLERYLPKALTIASAAGDIKRRANALRSLGELEGALGNLEAARHHYETALFLFQAEHDRQGEAIALRGLGDLEHQLGNLGPARHHYETALSLFQVEHDRQGEANALRSLADLEHQLGNLELARHHYETALSLFHTVGDHLGEANALRGLGELEHHLGNLELARHHYETALSLFQAVRYRLGEANALSHLGELEGALGNLELARHHYETALSLFQAIRDRLGEANTLRNLGDLERELGNLELARHHYETALSLFQAIRDRLGEAIALRGLGELERALDSPMSARHYYETALSIFQAVRSRQGEAIALRSLGELFLAQKEWLQARTYYEQALPLSVAMRDLGGQANILIDLGRARFELGDREQGLQDVQQAVALYHSIGNEQWTEYAEQYLTDMHARMTQHGDGNN